MAINPALRQVSNRNFLSPVGFKLKINKCPKVDFLATQANLPGITLGTAVQANPYKDLDVPGDKLVYDDFRVSFVVDEGSYVWWRSRCRDRWFYGRGS